jgi:cyanophycinase
MSPEAMGGYIVLEGGSEFGGRMAEADIRAIELAGGTDAKVSIVPAAAAPDHNHERAGQNGIRWFNRLGAKHVALSTLIDRTSANDVFTASSLRSSRLIYLLGGFPHYLAQILAGSISWQAILEAYLTGAVIGGSSAGAMVLCQHYFDPHTGSVVEGLNLVPKACVVPHHDTFGGSWVSDLKSLLPEDVLIGIDEETGMIDDGTGGRWNVYGKGSVTLYTSKEIRPYYPGEGFFL